MARGEGGSDEETFLGFVWMENLRCWSGLTAHLYFLAKPLEVLLANDEIFHFRGFNQL
jgi:hypothetical protein